MRATSIDVRQALAVRSSGAHDSYVVGLGVLLALVVGAAGFIALLTLRQTSTSTKVTLVVSLVTAFGFAAWDVGSHRETIASVWAPLLGKTRKHDDADLFVFSAGMFGPSSLSPAFERETAHARRTNSIMTLMSVSVMYAEVSALHGAMVAERMVLVVAQILKKSLGSSDVICHNEDGEFVVLLRGTTMAQAKSLEAAIRRASEEWTYSAKSGFTIRLEIGLGKWEGGLISALQEARSSAVASVRIPDIVNRQQITSLAARG